MIDRLAYQLLTSPNTKLTKVGNIRNRNKLSAVSSNDNIFICSWNDGGVEYLNDLDRQVAQKRMSREVRF